MSHFIPKDLSIAIISYAILHFLTLIWSHSFLLTLLSITGICIFILGLCHLTIRKFKLPIFLFIVGTTIIYLSGVPIGEGLLAGVVQMRDIIGLLTIVPLIGWVLAEEPY